MTTNRKACHGRSLTGPCDRCFVRGVIREPEDAAAISHDTHAVGVLESAAAMAANGGGRFYPMQHYDAGALGFFPGGIDLSVEAPSAYRETLIELGEEAFTAAASDHIDASRIDFRLQPMSPTGVSAQAAAMVKRLAERGACKEWPLLVDSAKLALTVATIRALSPQASMVLDNSLVGLTAAKRRRVMEYVDANLGHAIRLEDMAGVAAMSQFHFSRSFTKVMGMSPMRYVLCRRVEEAKRFLFSTSKPMSRVALACGFSSQAHMVAAFKKVLGVTPGAYRSSRL